MATSVADYIPKNPPLQHQAENFAICAYKDIWAHFWDMGTGKSYELINEACFAYENGKVDAILIVAPNGVERNWVVNEIPKHLPDRIERSVFHYTTKQAKNKSAESHRRYAISYRDGISIVCISYHAFVTEAGKKFVKEFLSKRKVAYILDESHHIKAPGSKRTKTIVASGKYANWKRIATGTPMGPNTAMDMYSQFRFLDDEFWKRHMIGDFALYKSFFGDWALTYSGYQKLLQCKNLDKLTLWTQALSTRLLKTDVLKNLPEKMHTRVYIELPSEHRRVYQQMQKELKAELLSGESIEIGTSLVALGKLMQIACGYIKNTETGETHLINDEFPRLQAAVEWAESSDSQAIIWCRFRHDIDLLEEALGSENVARYDGKIDNEQRAINLADWQSGKKKYFLSNPDVGGTGLTLIEANRALFYAVGLKSIELKQAQDRCHRIGQHNPVSYTYLVAQDTVDEQIIDAHLNNEDVIRTILGDEKIMELL